MGKGKWRKSSYSASQSACVEVGSLAMRVDVRDSKDRSAVLRFQPEQWRTFVAELKHSD
ncbi:DUF397 domain-containing protein [Saccharopolyspora sp. MS10]|uniref:DUF397 domain-containing protein n=1 Tax=Saccharopolyspora sp. MS10 TaxID=3385973 RepID=UPI0039A097F1